jgi:hypothetical protein
VTSDLNVNAETEEEIGIPHYSNDKNAKRGEKIECVPENVRVRILQAPFDECPDTVIHSIPEAQQKISPLIYARNVFE